MGRADVRLEDLIVRHLSAALSADEEQELAALLRDSSDARELFASYMRVEGATMQLAKAGCISQQPEPAAASDSEALPAAAAGEPVAAAGERSAIHSGAGASPPFVFWSVVASLLIAFGTYLYFQNQPSAVPAPEMEATPVARLIRSVDVQWQDIADAREVGARLTAGRMAFAAGLVEIEFDCGATVILEGPAEFEVVSQNRGFLQRGKLRSHVPPPAEGFTIDTAEVTVVDLGTEFGLHIDDSGNAEVHVFDGEVELHDASESPAGSPPTVLTAGNAMRIDGTGQLLLEADETSFVSRTMLVTIAKTYVTELHQQLDQLEQRQNSLGSEIKLALSGIKKSPEILQHQRGIQQAELALKDFIRENVKIAAAEKLVETTRRDVDALIQGKLNSNPEAVRLQSEIKRWRVELTELKRQLKEARDSRAAETVDRLHDTRQELLKTRRVAQKKLESLRRRIGRKDEDVKAAMREHNAARKAAEQLRRDPQYKRLRKALTAAKQARHVAHRKMLKESATLQSLRAEMNVVTSRIHKAKREIRDAQKTAEV